MNVGLIFIILFAICASVVGVTFIAASTNTTPTVDTYGREPPQRSNMTQGNVTAVMPVSIGIMSIVGIIVALLAVVAVIGAIWYSAKGTGTYGSRR